MRSSHWQKILAALILSVTLMVAGCTRPDTSPYAQTQQETTQRGAPAAVAREAEQGSRFNKFFPTGGNGYSVVYTQEKKGFSEAKLKRNGQDVAMLSISDTVSLPAAADKYKAATETLAGYPVLDIGNTQTGVLVGDRYQVKVQSRDPSFTPQDRRNWLQKFDLNGLSKL